MKDWACKGFYDLPISTFYRILKLRVDVFVVEQHCPYPELDGFDPKAYHIWGEENGQVMACARFFEKGMVYPDAMGLGRFVVDREFRGKGVGHSLLQYTLDVMEDMNPSSGIRISAQEHLEPFYRKYGFRSVSSSYLEDGIPHVEMYKSPTDPRPLK